MWNSPNIALTPAVGILDALVPVDVASIASLLTVFFNANLQAELAALAALPDIDIVDFDALQLLNTLEASPGAFGLSVVDAPCVTSNLAPFPCDAPDTYLFLGFIRAADHDHSSAGRTTARINPVGRNRVAGPRDLWGL